MDEATLCRYIDRAVNHAMANGAGPAEVTEAVMGAVWPVLDEAQKIAARTRAMLADVVVGRLTESRTEPRTEG